MELKQAYINDIKSLGFSHAMMELFVKEWDLLSEQGYDMYAIYKGAPGSKLEKTAACIICSNNNANLRWSKVITPSMDSAAIFCVCNECQDIYIDAAIRQKALGRLLKERNTRPS
jgi:hypothetical protein